eukprot:CAMPEP_0172735064 /NCGR_PEP_ID=MMETSP1074-20121228/111546_1 /TAXON_ID=2916 /ORGANISM="Ceratium fusus, Strain PA161109" /LENGTH=85 /DNA_ID=CAMNT_0013563981 /DNA_START=62 /DNA_END=322 /DNA_ORIENTATION=+
MPFTLLTSPVKKDMDCSRAAMLFGGMCPLCDDNPGPEVLGFTDCSARLTCAAMADEPIPRCPVATSMILLFHARYACWMATAAKA